jgi:hypothetical protein
MVTLNHWGLLISALSPKNAYNSTNVLLIWGGGGGKTSRKELKFANFESWIGVNNTFWCYWTHSDCLFCIWMRFFLTLVKHFVWAKIMSAVDTPLNLSNITPLPQFWIGPYFVPQVSHKNTFYLWLMDLELMTLPRLSPAILKVCSIRREVRRGAGERGLTSDDTFREISPLEKFLGYEIKPHSGAT